MSSPRCDWWGYAKAILRRYPNKVNGNEKRAVEKAIETTRQLHSGEERIRLANMVFFEQSHTMEGAGAALYISPRTAQRWHADFIREVGRNFRCNSLVFQDDETAEESEYCPPKILKKEAECSWISERGKQVISSMADNNMNQRASAVNLGITQPGVFDHICRIKERTGLDCRNFWDLVRLNEMIREQEPKKEDTDG